MGNGGSVGAADQKIKMKMRHQRGGAPPSDTAALLLAILTDQEMHEGFVASIYASLSED